MNLKDFTIQSEADDSYHLVHPSGKTFTVQKNGLNEKAHSAIRKMSCGGSIQKFDVGGSVIDQWNAEATPAPMNETALPQDQPGTAPVTPVESAVQSALPPPIVPPPVAKQTGATGSWGAPAPPVAPDRAPATKVASVDPMQASLDKSEGAVKNYLGQMNGANADSQNAQKDLINQIQTAKTPDQIFADYKAKDDQLMQHYMSQQVDPNRYLHNQSTGSKILAAIGIALSGAGAGANGKNLALEGINKAIENDIKAQESEQGKSLSLLKMNRDRSQDEMQARTLTQNQLLTGVQAKIAMANSKSQNADANLRGQVMIQQIEQQKEENRRKLALMSGAGGQTDPARLVPMLVPAEHQKQAFTEIGQAQSASENEAKIKDLFYQAAKDTRPATGRSGTSLMNALPLYTAPSIKNLNLLYDPLIHDNEGRINELEQQHVQANSPQFGDSDETVDKKWNAIKSFIEHKKQATTARAFGINPENFASTTSDPVARLNPQQQRIYQIAMANPGLPQSQLALKKLGVK